MTPLPVQKSSPEKRALGFFVRCFLVGAVGDTLGPLAFVGIPTGFLLGYLATISSSSKLVKEINLSLVFPSIGVAP
jgi:hypothetical protein